MTDFGGDGVTPPAPFYKGAFMPSLYKGRAFLAPSSHLRGGLGWGQGLCNNSNRLDKPHLADKILNRTASPSLSGLPARET